jgi:hypothetical protein
MGSKVRVEEFISALNHPLNDVIQLLRSIIYEAEPSLAELIKWNAPSFCYKEEDCITFNFPPKRDSVLLVFHRGTAKKELPKNKLIADDTGLLIWKTNDRAVVRFSNQEEVEKHKNNLNQIIKLWLEQL